LDITKYIQECGAILNTMPDTVLLLDKMGKIVFVNEASLKKYGYDKKDLVGKSFLELEFIPAYSKKIAAENMAKRLKGEQIKPYAISINAADGTPRYNELNAATMDWQGETIEIVVLRDITERRRTEQMLFESAERYRDLFEYANDLIQSVDTSGRYLYVNRMWRETLGYDQHEVDNITMFDVIHPDSLPHCQQLFGRVLEGETLSHVQVTFLTKDNKEIEVEGNVNCAYENGAPIATRGIFRDITKQKSTEEELEKMRRDFASMIVHDLRSPMTSIKGFTDLMSAERLGPISDKQSTALKIMKEAVDKQLALINDYLDLSKMESGQIDIDFQKVDIARPVSAAIRLVEVQAGLKKIALNSKIEAGLPAVLGSEPKLEQVLVNLLTNAVKFTDEGGSIVISAGKSKDAGMIEVSVSDTGIGIAADAMSNLFEKYRQIINSKASEQKGTGLGLVICKLIVEAHGGKIRAESEVGKGSTFYFTVRMAD